MIAAAAAIGKYSLPVIRADALVVCRDFLRSNHAIWAFFWHALALGNIVDHGQVCFMTVSIVSLALTRDNRDIRVHWAFNKPNHCWRRANWHALRLSCSIFMHVSREVPSWRTFFDFFAIAVCIWKHVAFNTNTVVGLVRPLLSFWAADDLAGDIIFEWEWFSRWTFAKAS